MKKKLVVIIVSGILTVILFVVSTYTQKKLINYEPKIECLFLNENIKANEKLTKEMFIKDDIEISKVSTIKVVKDYSEIDGMYAKADSYRGQIAIFNMFDTKENLSIYEVENGMEKTAIKIKSAENGVSYSIKNNSFVNVYVTLRSDLSKNFSPSKERLSIGDVDFGYEVIKVLENKMVLECFDVDGNRMSESDSKQIDTIILAVSPEEAKEINLLRELGSFNITGVNHIQSKTNNDLVNEDIGEKVL